MWRRGNRSRGSKECISATGDSIGVRRSAVIRVPFVLAAGVIGVPFVLLQVLIASVRFKYNMRKPDRIENNIA